MRADHEVHGCGIFGDPQNGVNSLLPSRVPTLVFEPSHAPMGSPENGAPRRASFVRASESSTQFVHERITRHDNPRWIVAMFDVLVSDELVFRKQPRT